MNEKIEFKVRITSSGRYSVDLIKDGFVDSTISTLLKFDKSNEQELNGFLVGENCTKSNVIDILKRKYSEKYGENEEDLLELDFEEDDKISDKFRLGYLEGYDNIKEKLQDNNEGFMLKHGYFGFSYLNKKYFDKDLKSFELLDYGEGIKPRDLRDLSVFIEGLRKQFGEGDEFIEGFIHGFIETIFFKDNGEDESLYEKMKTTKRNFLLNEPKEIFSGKIL